MNKLALVLAVIACTSTAQAAHWNVDYAKSKLGFTVRWSNEPFVAVFKSWKSDIDFDAADPAHAHVVTTIDIGSEASDTAENDDDLKGPQGFDASRFPAARFEATGFTPEGPGKYVASGKLTIHGITKPVRLPFSLTVKGDTAHIVGKVVVSRTDFGVGLGQWAAENPIAHAVTIDVDLTAKKAA